MSTKEALIFTQHQRVKPAYAGFLLWFTATQSKCEWQELEKKGLFKRDFENQHYGGPTFTDPLHCWALFISPASGHLSFISHHDPVSRQSRCAQRLRAVAAKQDFILHFLEDEGKSLSRSLLETLWLNVYTHIHNMHIPISCSMLMQTSDSAG